MLERQPRERSSGSPEQNANEAPTFKGDSRSMLVLTVRVQVVREAEAFEGLAAQQVIWPHQNHGARFHRHYAKSHVGDGKSEQFPHKF